MRGNSISIPIDGVRRLTCSYCSSLALYTFDHRIHLGSHGRFLSTLASALVGGPLKLLLVVPLAVV